MTKADLTERLLLAMGPQLAEQPPEDLVSQAHSIAECLTAQQGHERGTAIHEELNEVKRDRTITLQRETISGLRMTIGHLERKLAEMTKNRDDAGMQCLTAEAQLRNLRETSDAREERIEAQAKTVQGLRQDLRQEVSKAKLLQEQVDNQATRLQRVRQKVSRLRTQGDHLPTWARNLLQDADALLQGYEPPKLTSCRLSHVINRLKEGKTDHRHFEDVVQEAIDHLQEILE